jgi:exopolysaccharide biosynthesis WecB/TagA/CpsF family protein
MLKAPARRENPGDFPVSKVVAEPRADQASTRRITLMGIPIDRATEEEVIHRITAGLRAGRGGWVVTPNLDHLRVFHQRPDLLRIASEATVMIADGMPLVWAARLQGTPLPARVAGSDLIIGLTAAAARGGFSVFLLGGAPGAAEAASAIMTARHPDLRIAGILCPPPGFENDRAAVADIRKAVTLARPDIVYSCFGFPKQEWMIDQLRDALPAAWFLGLGGSLSMVAGELPRAPRWMRHTGFEWVHRLALEPERLFKRYIVQDAPFAVRLFGHALYCRWTLPKQNSRFTRMRMSMAPRSVAQTSISSHAAGNRRLPDETSRLVMKRYGSISASNRRRRWHAMSLSTRLLLWRTLFRAGYAAKRLCDVTASLILLAALSPLLALIAALIKLDSRGSVFFRQTRVGQFGKTFQLYKFRSMHADAEALKAELLGLNQMPGGVLFKIKDDPRVTRLGRILRRFSIDELPQLINVLKGQMSLVGPRPAVPCEVGQYTLAARRRLEVKPGITCIWQVSGRSELPFAKQVQMDVDYIDTQSAWLDLKLMARTVPTVLAGRGAY